MAAAAGAHAEELPVVLNGQYRDPVNAYKIGSAYFLNAKDAGQLYGGQVYWYPVSGRVQLSVRGRALQLQVDGDSVQVGDKMVKLDAPVMLRTSQAYIPLSFFEGEEFSTWAGMETSFNPRTKLLTLDRRSTLGGARWFTYKDHTRIVVELDDATQFKATGRGVGGVEVSFPLGTIDASEQTEINDGTVDYFSLTQGAQAAKLTAKFHSPGLKWKVKELRKPHRMVLDVFRGEVVATTEGQSEPAASTEPVKPQAAESPAVAQSEPAPAPEAAPIKSVGPVTSGKSEKAKRRIVVDAGHGGKDPGATGARGTLEKDINLKAALELAKLLKQEGTFEVLLTRADDTFVPLADRSRLANEFGADLFVSLHCNASRNPRDRGFEVYFMSEKATDPAAQELADRENAALELEGKTGQDVQAELLLLEMGKTENINAASELAALMSRDLEKRLDIQNNGVKQAGFYVLRGTHAPAILFEMAYVSNKADEAKLQAKKYRRKLVDGVYAGILEYGKRQGWLSSSGHRSGR